MSKLPRMAGLIATMGMLMAACVPSNFTPTRQRAATTRSNHSATESAPTAVAIRDPILKPPPSPLIAQPIALDTQIAISQSFHSTFRAMLYAHESERTSIEAIEPVTWPDVCLGLAGEPGRRSVPCAPQPTPGYRIRTQQRADVFIFRTDTALGTVRLEDTTTDTMEDPLLSFVASSDQQGNPSCYTIALGVYRVSRGICGDAMLTTPHRPVFVNDIAHQLYQLTSTYRSFSATLPSGTLIFTGTGSTTATPAAQRMIAESAQSIYARSGYGNYGAEHGRVIIAERRSGDSKTSVAFKRDGTVYVDGIASPRLLDDEALPVLYEWIDRAPRADSATDVVVSRTSNGATIRFAVTDALTPSLRAPEALQNRLLDMVQRVVENTGHVREEISPAQYASGRVMTQSHTSPNTLWRATVIALFPDSSTHYYQRLDVTSRDEQRRYWPTAGWSPFGIGYGLPKVVKWTADGTGLFFTNIFLGDGCQLFEATGKLLRLDLRDGQQRDVAPGADLTPDEQWAIERSGRALQIYRVSEPAQAPRVITITSALSGDAVASMQFGDVQWAPDSRAFTYTRIDAPCAKENPRAGAVRVQVDIETLAQTQLKP
jgi:hypothetical protein